jgi:hypothetical protein
VLDFSFKIDDDFDDYVSDISLYEESDEESDGENVQDLNPTYLWTAQNSDRFEFPHDIEPFEESNGPVNPPVRTSEPLEYGQWLSSALLFACKHCKIITAYYLGKCRCII